MGTSEDKLKKIDRIYVSLRMLCCTGCISFEQVSDESPNRLKESLRLPPTTAILVVKYSVDYRKE